MRRRGLAVLAMTVVALLVVGALVWDFGRDQYWWGESRAVRIRLADPMADPDLLGMTLLGSEQTPTVGPLGKPRPPFVTHWFLLPGGDLEAILSRTMGHAEEHGWTAQPETASATSATAVRTVDGEELTLILAFDPPDPAHPDRDNALRVTIT